MYSDLKMAFFSQLGRRTHKEEKGLFSLPVFFLILSLGKLGCTRKD
jgi:hypothetical protein